AAARSRARRRARAATRRRAARPRRRRQPAARAARRLRASRSAPTTRFRSANDACMRVVRRLHYEFAGSSPNGEQKERTKGVAMAQSIRELMTDNPRSLESGSTVMEAARLMRDEDTGIVPVVEGERLVGTVTDRDIAIRVVAEGRSPESVTVGEIASRELVTIDPQQDLDEALRLMARHQVRRLPVVEEDGKLVGIVAQADVAKRASEQRTGEVVEDISK